MLSSDLTQRGLALLMVSQFVPVFAAPADGAENSLFPTWTTVQGTGGRETGRCTGKDLDMLKDSWEEACLMAKKTHGELEYYIRKYKETSGKGPARPLLTDDPDYSHYHRVSGTFISLFGANPFNDKFEADENLNKLMTPLRQMKTRFCKPNPVTQFAYLFCGDDHYKFIKNGEPDPEHPDKKIEESHDSCSKKGGIWYSPAMPSEFKYLSYPPPKNPGEGPLCHDQHAYAATQIGANCVTFCAYGLDEDNHTPITLANLQIKGSEKRYKKGDMNKQRIIDALDNDAITHLDDLDGRKGGNMPHTWIHEMYHYIEKVDDQNAVDSKGQDIFETRTEWNEDKVEYEEVKSEVLAYGYTHARNLAKHKPRDAMWNPDNLGYFALAMYFDQWDWSKGYAMPIKGARF